jgi:hypothetical protein
MPHACDIARTSAMIRRSCALLAVVGLFLQGSHGGHMLLVEHTRCAEHGELIHGGESHGHLVQGGDASADISFEQAPDPSDDEAHEHCGHASERRDAVANVAQSVVVARSDRAAAVPDCIADHVSTRPRLYQTAPKNSPPA